MVEKNECRNENLRASWLIDLQMHPCNTSMWAKWMSIGQEGCTGAKRFQYDPFTQQNGNTLGCVTSGEARFKKTTNFYEGKKENLLFGTSDLWEELACIARVYVQGIKTKTSEASQATSVD